MLIPFKIRILGCGWAWGIPSIGMGWGNCNPNNSKNRRLRSSIYIQSDKMRLLIDASPDLRAQFLESNINDIDAVLMTHAHADHTRGLDDLGSISLFRQKLIPLYAHSVTLEQIKQSIAYTFTPPPNHPHYRPFFKDHTFDHNAFMIGDLPIQPFEQNHGFSKSWGFRIQDFAYSTDVMELSEESFQILQGVKIWIVDCLKYSPHPTHSHLSQTLQWIERVKPDRAILTHLSPDLDYETLTKQLPKGIEVAYDGMEISMI